MDGSVTISIENFEMLRRCEKAFNNMCKELNKCEFADEEGNTVKYERVLNAINIMLNV